MLVTPGPDLAYFTRYQPIAITERITMLVLQASRDPAMIVPILERPDAEAGPGVAALSLADWADGSDPYAATAKLLDPSGSYAISDSVWAMHVRRPPRERDRRRPRRFLLDHGHSEVDFTVVGSGPNGANPHHLVSERTINEGDMIVLDFGGIKDGYGSDTTRTVHAHGPTDEERAVFEVVGRAQQTAFEAVRPGIAWQEIVRAARKVIDDAGYGSCFIHRTAHGIGMTTHEPPYMIEGETHVLEPGMCFSIEPGIYLEGHFGVRIADIVTVTEDGGQRLNNTDHEMRIVS